MKIPLAQDLDIHEFSGSTVTEYESGLTNAILHKKGDRVKVTQRTSIDISEDSSDASKSHLTDRARGIYYWEFKTTLYIVHDKEVYKNDQATSSELTANITTGTQRVTILEDAITPSLIILDAENGEGWSMNVGETVSQITDAQFPTTLSSGGAILDSYLFVMDEDGYIYNSDVGAPTAFTGTSILNTERSPDKGVYLGKHHDHIVAFGTRSIEFFYDASNSVGSPLNRREDVSYNTGCASGTGVWENGDITYFLGSNDSGQISIYKMENFQIQPISNDTMSSYLTQGVTNEQIKVVFNGLSAMGHETLLITIYTLTGLAPGAIVPQVTFSYDSATGVWGFWNTALQSLSSFPLMAWTKRTGGHNATVAARTGEGILYNGDVVSINDRLLPVDTLLGASVFEDDVFEGDVFAATVDTGTNIDLIIRTGLQDGDVSGYKFQNKETVVMESTATSQTLTVKNSDEAADNFDAGNTIDTSDDRKDIFQGGRFVKRNYQLEYSGSEQVFIEAHDVDAVGGM